MQRPRWADLVDTSSDEEMGDASTLCSFAVTPSGASASCDGDFDMVSVPDVSKQALAAKRCRRKSPVRRRSVRMPIFTKQPPAAPVARIQHATVAAGLVRKNSAGRRVQGQPIPSASEEEWMRRLEKRRAAIELVKAMPEYQALRSSYHRASSGSVPRTPDPADRNISKRRWEAEVAIWRTATRRRCST